MGDVEIEVLFNIECCYVWIVWIVKLGGGLEIWFFVIVYKVFYFLIVFKIVN